MVDTTKQAETASTRVPDLTRLAAHNKKTRIFVLTDITNEPDDQESLVRYLLYSNEFNTRGLCATTSAWLGTRTAPDVIRKVVTAYGSVVDNLNKHVHPNAQYQSLSEVMKLVTSGHPVYGREALTLPPSDGARLLVERLGESTEPLWVLIWGGSNVLAEALQHISKIKQPDEAAALRSRLRVYAISDQDDTGEWIRINYPDTFYIVSIHGFGAFDNSTWQGIGQKIHGADSTKVSTPWLREHIQIGPLGAVYPTLEWMMEGDTPTFLYLIQNGLGYSERPDVGSWGGRYRAIVVGSSVYGDVVDIVIGAEGESQTDRKATIYRWRDHFQNDFAARMQWTLTPDFWAATHPPVPAIDGKTGPDFLHFTGKPGDTFVFDASDSYDPDHPEDNSSLNFQWYQYKEPTIRHPGGASFVPRCGLRPLSPPAGSHGTTPHNDSGFENVVLGPKVEVTIPDASVLHQWCAYTGITCLEWHVVLQVSSEIAKLPTLTFMPCAGEPLAIICIWDLFRGIQTEKRPQARSLASWRPKGQGG
ncbi:hypothetical protein MRS44_013447 [Fusarium solani]|uniref:uncharacterized protein n=1 Tax=Fusarium solani TaxID=169388 RepID=UPI0032C47FAE|nr:hypothetical protein MRS44_013447 [Fusarium solani]